MLDLNVLFQAKKRVPLHYHLDFVFSGCQKKNQPYNKDSFHLDNIYNVTEEVIHDR